MVEMKVMSRSIRHQDNDNGRHGVLNTYTSIIES